MEEEVFSPRTDLSQLNQSVTEIKTALAKVVVGQHEMITLLIAGILGQRTCFD